MRAPSMFLCLFGLLCLTNSVRAQELTAVVPPGANALMVIDVESALASPLAKKQGWQSRFEQAAASRPLMVPPQAKQIVLAAELDLADRFASRWELAVMMMAQPVAPKSIALAEGGYVDTIRELPAVWVPSDAYFVTLDTNKLAAMHPADRQLVSRWIEYAKSAQSPLLNSYLVSASQKATKATPIVLALNLREAVIPHQVKAALETSPVLQNQKEKIPAMVELFQGLKGLTVQVALTDSAQGTISIDFSSRPSALQSVAKDLLMNILNDLEMGIPDLENWKSSVEGNSIQLRGELTDGGMRRLFSLLEIPSTKFASLQGESPDYDDPDKVKKASQAYYASVSTLIDDLHEQLDRDKYKQATWAERYARKVDLLPILNVDEELLAWGAQISETFRSIALAERGANIASGVRKSQLYGAYQYQYDGNGYYSGARSNESVGNQITAEQNALSNQARFSSWKQVEDSRIVIRQAMVKKFQAEF